LDRSIFGCSESSLQEARRPRKALRDWNIDHEESDLTLRAQKFRTLSVLTERCQRD
jgi:hypothetical protein